MKILYGKPDDCADREPEERAVYDLLDRLGVEYGRIDHEAVMTMEACEEIERVLDVAVCKNLFLCNRQKTEYYLLLMPGDKSFHAKELSAQTGCARLSFAKADAMESCLHIKPGAVSVLGLMNDSENRVRLIIDRAIVNSDFIGCHPCVNTSSLKLRTVDLLERILPAVHHDYAVVDLPAE